MQPADSSFAGDLSGRHIVLGLSGGIACYKAAELTRELVKAGATVQIVMTESAEHDVATREVAGERRVGRLHLASAPAGGDEGVEQRLRLGALPVELADDDMHRTAVATDDDGARKDARRPRDRRLAVAVEQDRRRERRTVEEAADDLGSSL